ncbi:MAG: response regulator, partial [Chloroflexi bacterium]
MTRVLIADDQRLVREGVRKILDADPAISVVGEATDGPSALALARTLKPDLILLDNIMPGLSGLDVARTLASELPEIGIVFLTVDPGSRDLALAAGATTYVQKDAPADELRRAVHATGAAMVTRRRLSGLRPDWRRVIELLLGSRALTEAQVDDALARAGAGESLGATLTRLGLVAQAELADVLARASGTPLVSLAPYPEIAAPIDPTESRISSPRLVDPVERDAARLLPVDIARGMRVVVTAATGGDGVLAMADPLDLAALAEAQRLTRLRLNVVTATSDDVDETLVRAWGSGAPGPVVSLGDIPSRLETNVLVAVIALVWGGGFAFLFRDALQPRFGLSLLALTCGFVFFVY